MKEGKKDERREEEMPENMDGTQKEKRHELLETPILTTLCFLKQQLT